jgi:predicted dehydrogenase
MPNIYKGRKMEKSKIRIGFIGLNPNGHWAAMAHLPALRHLSDEFDIVGVANSSLESAKRTAKALNLQYAFKDYHDLVGSKYVDLVVVTVKVPNHFEIVKAALLAGKHVYCEWPLANGLDEVSELETLARKVGVVAVIGTQMRFAPEITYLKQLVNDGFIGHVLSTTLVGTGGNWGNESLAEHYYLFDRVNGGSMLEIPVVHTLVGLSEVLGDIAMVSATMFSNFEEVKIKETDEWKPKTAEDQIMLQGRLQSGAALSVHYRGGSSLGTNFLWEINGTDGDIRVSAETGHGQLAKLKIMGAKSSETDYLKVLNPPDEWYENWPKFPGARNIGYIYKQVASDIRFGSRTAPSFTDGLKWQRLIDIIKSSSEKNEISRFHSEK